MNADSATLEAERIAHGFFPAADALRVSAVHGGANNRVWRVDASGGSFLLKQYFQAPAPARNRFASERAFYEYASSRVSTAVPCALNWNADAHAALFSFISGRKLSPSEITRERVSEALDFFRRLNTPPANPSAPLPDAAEACFSVASHLATVEIRIQRLLTLSATASDNLANAARKFARDELAPAWRKIANNVRAQVPALDAAPPARCISPSDFGFHNALLDESGRLRFFDFEYAGWDDPAKTTCDFLCQPELPVGEAHREYVLDTIAQIFPGDLLLAARARALLPVYQIKWCGIMLNEFLPTDRHRRDFALSPAATQARRQRQLDRARAALAALAAS
jgi:hypothetical protein